LLILAAFLPSCLPALSAFVFPHSTTSPPLDHRSSCFISYTQIDNNRISLYRCYDSMNWTGGRLQRSKRNAKSSDLVRQRQHFAAVRQRLQNGPTSHVTPFCPSFLDREEGLTLAGGITPFGQGSQRHTGHPKGKQRRLEDYSPPAPLAGRLASIQMGPSRPLNQSDRQQKPPSSENNSLRVTEESQPKYEERNRGDSSPRSRIDAASTPSQCSTGRKRAKSKLGPDDVLELSRKKLLLQSDWIGLASSRPVQMTFTSRQDKDRIGKRRKIDSSIQGRPRRLGKINQGSNDYTVAVPAQSYFMSGALRGAPESISVRIGDQALSTQVSAVPLESIQPQESMELMRQSSESMLFDIEQRKLSQPQGFRQIEVTAEEEQRHYIKPIYEQEISGTKGLPLCISDDTDTEDCSSSPDVHMKELEPADKIVDAPADDGLGVERLPDQLNGRDNGLGQREDFQTNEPQLETRNRVSLSPALIPLMFESSSVHNSAPRSDSLSQVFLSKVANDSDQLQRNSTPFQAEKTDDSGPKFVGLHVAQSNQSKIFQNTGKEWQLNERGTEDEDAAWKRFFSIASSDSALFFDAVEAEQNAAIDSDNSWSTNTSLATARDPEVSTLRPAQSFHDAESSVFFHNSPSTSLRNITSLAEQQSHQPADKPTHSDPNEFWRKFVFGGEDDDDTTASPGRADSPPPRQPAASSLYVGPASTHVGSASTSASEEIISPQNGRHADIVTSHSRVIAARPTVSAWPAPLQSNRSMEPDLTSRSSLLESNTSSPDAPPSFRAWAKTPRNGSKACARASAALSMKNNASNPSSSTASTDAPAKGTRRQAYGRSVKHHRSNREGEREIAHSGDQRQLPAAQGPVMFTAPSLGFGNASKAAMKGGDTGGCGTGRLPNSGGTGPCKEWAPLVASGGKGKAETRRAV
jgi:hypothetical protein